MCACVDCLNNVSNIAILLLRDSNITHQFGKLTVTRNITRFGTILVFFDARLLFQLQYKVYINLATLLKLFYLNTLILRLHYVISICSTLRVSVAYVWNRWCHWCVNDRATEGLTLRTHHIFSLCDVGDDEKKYCTGNGKFFAPIR